MPRVRWTPQARQELKEVAKYIARQDNRPRVASKLVDDVRDKLELYAQQPGMGTWHSELPTGFRYFAHKRYIIIYQPRDDGIIVHGVVDGAREWTRLFGGQSGRE
jgi:plasmid stabilization system protein ParE